MQFLPSLRRRRSAPVSGEIVRASGSPSAMEVKLLLADYYATLANYGTGLHEPAKAWPLERAVAEGYERVVWAFKAVAVIGENTAREDVPFEVVEGEKDDLRVVEDHPIARLLNGRANPLETGSVFLERLSAQLLLSKRGAFVEVVKSNMGTPVRLDLLPPSRTRIVPGYESLVDHYEVTRLDGTRYNVEADRVRWVRRPHPIDPYSGMTPLEAAGMSVELDYFARLYNLSFMRNDGRPGGIVGITGPEPQGGGLNDTDLQKLEARFGRGPTEAGKISVVEGEITYADLAAKPRDSSYNSVSSNCKTEILCAFGTPESILGNASGRTFDNAEQEDYSFWSITMSGHLSRISSAFLADVEEGQKPRFNLEAIGALQLPARQRRAEAREEVAGGLRSPKSYADLAGYGDEIGDLPHTRALWMPSGKTPLPTRPEDAEPLGMGSPVEDTGGTGEPSGGTGPTDAIPGQPADAAVGGGSTGGGPTEPNVGGPVPPPSPLAGPLGAPASRAPLGSTAGTASGGFGVAPAAPAATVVAPTAIKATALEAKAAEPWREIDPVDTQTGAEDAIAAALVALVPRWTERAAARLRSPKTRKGTRHFTPEYERDTRVGTKALDAAYAADESNWADEAEDAVRDLVEDAALRAALAFLTDLDPAAAPDTVADLPVSLRSAALDAASAAVPPIVSGAAWQARRTARTVTDLDASGGTVEDAVDAVTDRSADITEWALAAAADAAAAATAAGHAAAADWAAANDPAVRLQRQWFSRKDGKVRDTHTLAHGQRRGIDAPFQVGLASLRFPGDPLGPPGEVRNCRCRAVYRVRRSGQFATTPAGAQTRRAAS